MNIFEGVLIGQKLSYAGKSVLDGEDHTLFFLGSQSSDS